MVMCFAADCNHQSLRDKCSFYRFPKEAKRRKLWEAAARRADTTIIEYSRLCSCHFEDGKNGIPSIFPRNKEKLMKFPFCHGKERSVIHGDSDVPIPSTSEEVVYSAEYVHHLQDEVEELKEELKQSQMKFSFEHISHDDKLVSHYTGFPNAQVFMLIVNYCKRFEIKYYHGSNVTKISYVDQVFLTCMKLRQNFSHLDLSVRFSVRKQ